MVEWLDGCTDRTSGFENLGVMSCFCNERRNDPHEGIESSTVGKVKLSLC
jgi:hypothetical protein